MSGVHICTRKLPLLRQLPLRPGPEAPSIWRTDSLARGHLRRSQEPESSAARTEIRIARLAPPHDREETFESTRESQLLCEHSVWNC